MIFEMQQKEDISNRNHSDFSIEHILNYAGRKCNEKKFGAQEDKKSLEPTTTFSWLHCSRFCPPKIPRAPKRDGPHKRQLGRYPRIPFTNQQIAILEDKFQQNHYLTGEEAVDLSRRLNLTVDKIKIWFQNRRARKRREELGEIRKVKETSTQSNGTKMEEGHKDEDSVIDIVGNQPTVSLIYYGDLSISNQNVK